MNGIEQQRHTNRVAQLEKRLDDAAVLLEAQDARFVELAQLLQATRTELNTLRERISDERTHRLKLAEEQRRYVDGLDRNLDNRLRRFEAMTLREAFRWLVRGRLR